MKEYNLLPRNFKMIGLIIISLSFIIPVTLGILHILPHLSGWKEEISKTLFLIGLLLIAFTREKVEDEFVNSCRLKAMFYAFTVSIAIYLGFSIMSVFRIEAFTYSAFRILFFQIALYLIYFYLNIRGITDNYAK